MRVVKSYRSFYTSDGDRMDEGSSTGEHSCEPDEVDRIEEKTAVTLAVELISGRLYCHEVSREPWSVGAWYSRSDTPDQTAPEGAYTEETTAHLEGFSPEEEREVFTKLLAGGHLV